MKFMRKEFWSKADVMKYFKDRWDMGDRTLDFYVRQEIILPAGRIPGKKEVYWEKAYIKPVVELIIRLKLKGWTLDMIKGFVNKEAKNGSNKR